MSAIIHSTTEVKNDMKECGICNETLQEPRTLGCHHAFCLKCLTIYAKYKSVCDNISCPVCRKVFRIPAGGFGDMSASDLAGQLKIFDDASKQENEKIEDSMVICNHCITIGQKEPAKAYCKECNENMCAACFKKHSVNKVFSNHNGYRPRATLVERSQVNELLKMNPNCLVHPNNLMEFYCCDCKIAVCQVCISAGDHKGHKCLLNKEAVKELSQGAYQEVAKWSFFKKETEEFVQRADSTLTDFRHQIREIRDNLAKRYELVRNLPDKQYQELLQNLDKIETKRVKELETMKEEGKQETLMLESLERHWNEVKARGSDCDVVQAAISLQNKSEEVVKKHENQMSAENVNKCRNEVYQVDYNPHSTFTSIFGNTEPNVLGIITEKINNFYPDWNRLLKYGNVKSFILNEIDPNDICVATHKNEVYMTSTGIPNILVYSLQNLSTVSRQISVPGLTHGAGLVFNDLDSCLYVTNYSNPGHIHKINTRYQSTTGWALQISYPWGLSISKNKNLLVSYTSFGQIDEYSDSGLLIRSIRLSGGITGIFHAVESAYGEFIVCQYQPLHRICLVNSSGNISKSYGKEPGSGVGELKNPMHIQLDQKGNVLVSDWNNNKLRILTPNLTYMGDVNITDATFKEPTAFCWEKENDRLLVTTRSKCLYAITPQFAAIFS